MNQQPFEPFSDGEPSAPKAIDLSRERRRLAIPSLAVSFVFLFTTVLQTLIVTLVSRFRPALMDYDWYVWVVSMVPMYAIAMPLSLLFYKAEPVHDPIPKRKLGFPVLLGLVAICFTLTYAGNFLGQLVNGIIGSITGEMPDNQLQELTMSSPLWTNLLFCGILAPIMEEIFYRKMLVDRLRRYGDLPAILLSGILFGLIHGNFNQFFYAAMIGMVFGFIYLRTGNILYTIALHMCINLVGGVYSTEMLKRLDLSLFETDPLLALGQSPAGLVMLLVYLAFVLLCFVGAPVALALLFKRIRFQKSQNPLSPSQWTRAALINPGVWVLAVTVILLFVS